MTVDQQNRILANAKTFFRNGIVENHINVACVKASKLSEYNVNPFLFKYLANFLTGNDNPESIARALVLPRILGSSITTSFGMGIQTLISTLFEGMGSTTQGIDIEFVDTIDGRKKYCQLKAGPNTINKDDVKTVIDHFQGVRNLARTNNVVIGLQDLVVGIVYGEEGDLSSHYRRIQRNHYTVHIGQDFWNRLTGNQDFYFKLIDAFGEVAVEVDGRRVIEQTINTLAADISNRYG